MRRGGRRELLQGRRRNTGGRRLRRRMWRGRGNIDTGTGLIRMARTGIGIDDIVMIKIVQGLKGKGVDEDLRIAIEEIAMTRRRDGREEIGMIRLKVGLGIIAESHTS